MAGDIPRRYEAGRQATKTPQGGKGKVMGSNTLKEVFEAAGVTAVAETPAAADPAAASAAEVAVECDGDAVPRHMIVTRKGEKGKFEPSLLPKIGRFRLYKLRSRAAKGIWVDCWSIQVKVSGSEGGEWIPASRVASDAGMSFPADFPSKGRALERARKAKESWGKPRSSHSFGPARARIVAELKAEIDCLRDAIAAAKAAKTAVAS